MTAPQAGSRGHPFTPAEDAALLAGVRAGTPYRRLAVALDRSRSGLMARYALLTRPPKPAKPKLPLDKAPPAGTVPRWALPWLPAEDAYLRQHWGTRGIGAIARRLGRNAKGTRNRACRLGLAHQVRGLTPATLARVLGVDAGTVRRWIRSGRLGAVRRPVGDRDRRQLCVPDEALEAWLARYGHPYEIARMTPADHWVPRLARRVLGDPSEWVTLDAAAREVHYARTTLYLWIGKGDLPARKPERIGRGVPIVVRRTELAAAVAAHEALVSARIRAGQERFRRREGRAGEEVAA